MHTRTRLLPTAFSGFLAASLLLAAVPLASQEAGASHPKGVILALDLDPRVAASLNAAGYAQCSAPRPPVCYDLVSVAAFSSEANGGFQGRKVIYVGGADVNSAAANALFAKRNQIATFVSQGGGLVAYASPYAAAAFDYLPGAVVGNGCPGSATLCTTISSGNTVVKTPLGTGHDTLNGVTNAQLSGWQSSFHQYFTKKPTYLSALAHDGNAAHWVVLAGFHGKGCVYASGQDLAWHAANLGWNGGASAASPRLVKQSVDWALLCGCPIHYRDVYDDRRDDTTSPFLGPVDDVLDLVEAVLEGLAPEAPCEVVVGDTYVLCDGTVWQESNGIDGLQRYESGHVDEHGQEPQPVIPADTQIGGVETG